MSENLAREQAVRTLVARIAHTIDTRRWNELRALYADEVTTDYTSLFGGEAQRQSGEALIVGWRELLGKLDATQHLVGPIDVRLNGDRATAECHVRGYHIRRGAAGGDEWMVAGQWVIEAVESEGRWRVIGMTLRTFYETGSRGVLVAS
jgi:SnoaL-like domain